MNERGLQVDAWYGSDNYNVSSIDKEFGVRIKWDIPLLEGYGYRFFRNISWKPSPSSGFWGLINLSMIVELFKIPRSVIVVHGWHYLTHFLVIMLGSLKGHTICIRHDMPLSHEKRKMGLKQKVKRFGLKYVLFPRVSYFLYIGTQNRLFYESYNLPHHRLISCPYAVDNARFSNEKYDIKAMREKFNIPQEDKVILFSAKYIDKKRPMDLLNAFKKLNKENCWLLMIGEGKLRKEMENFIKQNQLKNVLLTGFVNQSVIPQYYAISNVLVMCSTVGESWGLSVNEAMNYNLPLVLSDLTGCSDDLVIEGVNGYTFKTGDVVDLTQKIKDVLFNNKLSWDVSSRDIIKKYSYESVVDNIKRIL